MKKITSSSKQETENKKINQPSWSPFDCVTSRVTQQQSRRHPVSRLDFQIISYTMIHSGTLCIQRKVTKFPCFGGLVFRAQFQHFLSAFWRSFFAMQLAPVSMITITPTLSLSVFSLQRTGFSVPAESSGAPAESSGYTLRCSGDLTCGYFRGRRDEAEKPKNERGLLSGTGRSITVPIPPVTLNGHCGVILQSIFKPDISLESSCPDLNEHVLFL